MGKGIAFAGNLVVDYIKYVDAYPAPQELAAITGMERSVGGLVCNCALTLAKLDPRLPVKAIGIVGDDEAGGYVLSRFSGHANVDASWVVREGRTAFTDVVTDAGLGQRTFFTYKGANSLLTPDRFDFTVLDAGILHIGYISLLDGLDAPYPGYPTAMCRVLDMARRSGMLTSVDAVTEGGARLARLLPPALEYADYCIINEHEAARATGIPLRGEGGGVLEGNLRAACSELIAMGVGRWAVVHMPELSCGMERGGAFVERHSWKIPEGFMKSPVGAGDAFACGVLYGAYNGWSLDKSLGVAGAVAAYSLSGAGGSDAIKPLAELMREMEGYQPKT